MGGLSEREALALVTRIAEPGDSRIGTLIREDAVLAGAQDRDVLVASDLVQVVGRI